MAAAPVDVADALAQSVRAGFGALSLTLALALRALTESAQNGVRDQRGLRVPASDVADLLVGTAWGVARLSGRLTAMGARVAAPLCGLALRPPLLPRRLQPVRGVQKVVRGWQRDRPETLHALGRWSAAALPGALDAMLAQVDARQVAAVALDRVDLDVLVTDLESAPIGQGRRLGRVSQR